ncbi:MAG: hypothetical protein JO028_06435 [Acidobacteriaceae bacterium]|nr:hypothetical protein [Acidobacteriaceae bacterium]
MKLDSSRMVICAALACASIVPVWAQGKRGHPPHSALTPTGSYTTVSGTISQFNYSRDAEIEGFLLSNNILVHLPPRAAVRIVPSLHAGDNVQVSGLAQTSPSGFQRIEAQSLQDRTSGKTFTMPQPGAAAPYSGSGRVQQLNYGADGAVNGFLLNDGTLVTVPPFNADNPTSIRVGATVSYSGYAHRTMNDRTVVNAQSLTINGQQLALAAPAGPGGPRGAAPPPPPPSPAIAGVPTNLQGPPPQNRTAEPPLPPSPPAAPPQ